MINHIVAWKLKSGLSDAEKSAAADRIKSELEALVGVVDGLVSLNVHKTLSGCAFDLTLISRFENAEALSGYRVHPRHVEAAGFVHSVIEDRTCIDF